MDRITLAQAADEAPLFRDLFQGLGQVGEVGPVLGLVSPTHEQDVFDLTGCLIKKKLKVYTCLLYTSPSPRDS